MGLGDWSDEWVECDDPRGGKYFWMAGSYESYNPDDESTDTWALNHGYTAITPITLDQTAYGAFDFLEGKIKG